MTEKNSGETRLSTSGPPAASPSEPVEIVGHSRRPEAGEGSGTGEAARDKRATVPGDAPSEAKPAGTTPGAPAGLGSNPGKPPERPLPGTAPPARRPNPNGAPPWYLRPGPAGSAGQVPGGPAGQAPGGPAGQTPAASARPLPEAAPPAPARPPSPGAPGPARERAPETPRPASLNGLPPAPRPVSQNGAPPATPPERAPASNGGRPQPASPAPAAGRPAPAPGTWRPLPGPALASPQRAAPARTGRLSSFAPDPEPAAVRPAPAPPSTAQDFAPGRVRPEKVAPATRGWRLAVRTLTFGGVSPGPGHEERRERELVSVAKTPIATCRRVAIVSRKGGIGKTTTTLMLGHTFATHRGDRVVALDANPDAGSLAYRVNRQTGATVTQLLRAVDRIQRYSDMRGFTSQASTRLEVLASDDDPTISVALGEAEYREVLNVLEHHYNLILMDTGTGILDSATQGILRMADQIVLCAAPGIDASRASSLTLDWLDEHGYHDLVRDAVVVINQVRKDRGKELRSVVQHFSKRCRAVVKVPWDAHLAEGMEVDIDLLRAATRRSYLDAVAAVARSFTLPSPRR